MGTIESRLVLVNRLESLSPLLAFARERAAQLGFSKERSQAIELILEEAVTNVIKHAFKPGEEATFDVTFSRSPGKLVIGVEDRGLPFDLESAEGGRLAGIGLRLTGAFADELHFTNLGKHGKRVEIVQNLPAGDVRDHLTEKDSAEAAEKEPPSQAEVTIRPAGPEDAVGVSRCMYRTYGYTDPRDFIYYPERFRETLATGLVESRLAVTADGEVAGAWFITRSEPGSGVGETARGIVDPRFRGRHLFENIVKTLLDHVRGQGMYGLITHPVTNHPFSQKALMPFGASPTAIYLGYGPDTMSFREMAQGPLTQRLSVLVEYLKLADGPRRTVYAPPHHAGMIRRIFEEARVERDFADPQDVCVSASPDERTRLDIHMLSEIGQAHITVAECGKDCLDKVRFARERILSSGIPAVYIDLPLGAPWTASLAAPVEALGFYFAGVVPDLHGGDMLTLQHLGGPALDRSKIVIASDFGKEILDYVWSQLVTKQDPGDSQ